jgi:glycosyltransferase involved in cell wall biosynthesis
VIPNVVCLNETGKYSDCLSKKAIFAGRFSRQKDIESLFEIWKLVHKRHPDWELNAYGEGEQWGEYAELAKNIDINIHVYPPSPAIFDHYRESSILLMTSIYEPFGLVLPEAMSCGLPVVAFNCPYGPSDIITDGVDGILVVPHDIDAFVDGICSLIDNLELRETMGNAGVKSSQRYRYDQIMPKWISLFEQFPQ